MNTGEDHLEAMFSMESDRTGLVEEPPFRLLALGDWSGDAERGPLAGRPLIEIDRDNFDEVIERLGTRLELNIAGGSIALEFRSLDDFHPDALFRSVPMFEELRDLRRRLNNESTFNSAAREVRDSFGISAASEAAAEPTEAPPADNLLDAILTQPSGGAAAPKPGLSPDLGRLVGELVRPHLVSVDGAERSQLVAAVDEAIGGLMRAVIHDRRFQELEAAWRGLHFMVKRTETSTDLKVFILDISKAELLEDLKSAASLSETTLYKHVVHDAVETPGADPWAAVLGNYAFEPIVDDVAGLIRISKISAGATISFISHMRPDVLGVRSLAEHSDPAEWRFASDDNAVKLWEALRDQSESVYLAMAMPRFLARLPYGKDTDPAETISFEEFTETPAHDQYVWANPAFAVGQLIAESHSAYGWQMGRAFKQDIEGLPVHIYKDGTETVFKPCSEVLLSQIACERMMDHGIMPLVSYKNTDRVKLARFQSIADTAMKGIWAAG
ncbi:MAG: type VI secretion system contractile sheath large subunit [Pyrinomonadaceae bacterium]|nr:type VI secretion system contractile sheath large subunit [Pyrinomonadaceae bacterium]